VLSWTAPSGFDTTRPGTYFFTAVLGAIPQGFANSSGLTASIKVVITSPAPPAPAPTYAPSASIDRYPNPTYSSQEPQAAPTPKPTPAALIPQLSVVTAQTANDLARELFSLSLFVGTGKDTLGNPTFELEKPLTRLESMALVLRLLGLEETANKYKGVNPFTDVDAWGDRIAAYGYNIGITVGINEEHTLFAANRNVTLQEFTAFLLRVLAYSESKGDFEYVDALNKAIEVSLFSDAEVAKFSKDKFIRAESVVALVNALLSKVKGSDARLIDRLVEQKVISKEAADLFIKNVKAIYPR
jgi:hypothetical protein